MGVHSGVRSGFSFAAGQGHEPSAFKNCQAVETIWINPRLETDPVTGETIVRYPGRQLLSSELPAYRNRFISRRMIEGMSACGRL